MITMFYLIIASTIFVFLIWVKRQLFDCFGRFCGGKDAQRRIVYKRFLLVLWFYQSCYVYFVLNLFAPAIRTNIFVKTNCPYGARYPKLPSVHRSERFTPTLAVRKKIMYFIFFCVEVVTGGGGGERR